VILLDISKEYIAVQTVWCS